MKFKNNYHTHTYRCGHALGTDEEYVRMAIKAGFKELGFSDHCPFPNVIQRGVRMDFDQLDDYINSLKLLREKYKDQIKIYIGFEAEYYHEIRYYYEDLLKDIDYLICGQHFALLEKEQVYVGFKKDSREMAEGYVNRVVEAMESGLFKYIAHPDIIFRSYTLKDDFQEMLARRICKAAERTHTPLEINLEGMRRKISYNEPFAENYYPFPSFWKIVSEYNIDVIIGGDFHDPNNMLMDYDKYAFEIVAKYHLHLIDKINI